MSENRDVPLIESEVDNPITASVIVDNPKETQDISNQRYEIEARLKEAQQKHDHKKEDFITRAGIWIVCGILLAGVGVTVLGILQR